MNLYLRLLMALLRCRFQQPIDTSGCIESVFRVWPHDIDAFGHMNNGRYLQIMDVARASWMARAGVLKAMWRERWGASLGGGTIRFRRSLKPFQRYRVTTRLVGWDARWFYLEHGFLDDRDRCIAVGLSRAALRGRGDWVRTDEIMSVVDPSASYVPVPDYAQQLTALEETLFREFSQNRRSSDMPACAKHVGAQRSGSISTIESLDMEEQG